MCEGHKRDVDAPQAQPIKFHEVPQLQIKAGKTAQSLGGGGNYLQGKTSLYRFFSMFSGSRAQLRNRPGFLLYKF